MIVKVKRISPDHQISSSVLCRILCGSIKTNGFHSTNQLFGSFFFFENHTLWTITIVVIIHFEAAWYLLRQQKNSYSSKHVRFRSRERWRHFNTLAPEAYVNSIIYKEPKFLKNYQNQIQSPTKISNQFSQNKNEYDQMYFHPCSHFNVSSNRIRINQGNSSIQIKRNQWQRKSSCFSSPWPRQQIQNWSFIPLDGQYKNSWVSSHPLDCFNLPIFVLFLLSFNTASSKFKVRFIICSI